MGPLCHPWMLILFSDYDLHTAVCLFRRRSCGVCPAGVGAFTSVLAQRSLRVSCACVPNVPPCPGHLPAAVSLSSSARTANQTKHHTIQCTSNFVHAASPDKVKDLYIKCYQTKGGEKKSKVDCSSILWNDISEEVKKAPTLSLIQAFI